MAAHDNLGKQFRQLTLFEPASKLADPTQTMHGDENAFRKKENPNPTEALKAYKVGRASTRGMNEAMRDVEGPMWGDTTLRESIEKRGVVNPVAVFDRPGKLPHLGNGHHRVFAANDINPQTEVPVSWRQGMR